MIRCLRENGTKFTGECRSKALAVQRLAYRDVRYNLELRRACGSELKQHCGSVTGSKQLKVGHTL